MNCKQCGKEMNPVQAILSSTHGVCGSCTRKNHRLVINGKEIEEIIAHQKKKARINASWGKFNES